MKVLCYPLLMFLVQISIREMHVHVSVAFNVTAKDTFQVMTHKTKVMFIKASPRMWLIFR